MMGHMKTPELEYQEFSSEERGPRVVILGGIHGNEPTGVRAIEQFLQEDFSLQRGSLVCAIGNPEALQKDVRYIDHDLNRSFLKDADSTEKSYEKNRAQTLMPLLETADYLLDIHTASADTAPFVICEESALPFVQTFWDGIITVGWNSFPGACGDTESFVNQHGGTALTFEAGSHQDPHAVVHASRILIQFLAATTITTIKIEPLTKTATVFELFQREQKQPDVDYAHLAQAFQNFQKVQQGEVILQSSIGDIIAPENCVIVFPREPEETKVGEELFFLARKKS